MRVLGKIKNQIKYIKIIGKKVGDDCLPSFSAHAALFGIMSLFPLTMFLSTFIRYIPIDIAKITEYASDYIPDTLLPLMLQIIDEVYSANGASFKLVTLLVILYCASKGFYAIRLGLNAVYEIKESRNIVLRNLIAVWYVFGFTIMMIFILVAVVLGEEIIAVVSVFAPAVFKFRWIIRIGRGLTMILALTIFFLVMYIVIPNRKTKIGYELPGAIIASVGWTVFSSVFSYYRVHIAQFSVTYGSLATMVVIMLWFYCAMYIFFLGAEYNFVRRKIKEKTISH